MFHVFPKLILLVLPVLHLPIRASDTKESEGICPTKSGTFVGQYNKECYYIWVNAINCYPGKDIAILDQDTQTFLSSSLNSIGFDKVCVDLRVNGNDYHNFTWKTEETHVQQTSKALNQRVTRLVERGKFVQSEALFTQMAYLPSTCSRFCGRTTGCVVLNFNQADMSCRGFSSRGVLETLEDQSDWTVWEFI